MEKKNMLEEIFQKQDAFVAKMVAAFDKGEINVGYKPYIEWKRGRGTMPTSKEIDKMITLVATELNHYYITYPEAYKEIDSKVYLGEYKGFKEDAEKVAILEAIDAEIMNLDMC